MDTALLVVIVLLLVGVLTAMKSGFNEVIKGLEAIANQATDSRR